MLDILNTDIAKAFFWYDFGNQYPKSSIQYTSTNSPTSYFSEKVSLILFFWIFFQKIKTGKRSKIYDLNSFYIRFKPMERGQVFIPGEGITFEERDNRVVRLSCNAFEHALQAGFSGVRPVVNIFGAPAVKCFVVHFNNIEHDLVVGTNFSMYLRAYILWCLDQSRGELLSSMCLKVS